MTLTIELGHEQAAVLRTRARQEGATEEQVVTRLVEDALAPAATNNGSLARGEKSLAEEIAEIFADVPADVELPADLAEQHDHYAYGCPKK